MSGAKSIIVIVTESKTKIGEDPLTVYTVAVPELVKLFFKDKNCVTFTEDDYQLSGGATVYHDILLRVHYWLRWLMNNDAKRVSGEHLSGMLYKLRCVSKHSDLEGWLRNKLADLKAGNVDEEDLLNLITKFDQEYDPSDLVEQSLPK